MPRFHHTENRSNDTWRLLVVSYELINISKAEHYARVQPNNERLQQLKVTTLFAFVIVTKADASPDQMCHWQHPEHPEHPDHNRLSSATRTILTEKIRSDGTSNTKSASEQAKSDVYRECDSCNRPWMAQASLIGQPTRRQACQCKLRGPLYGSLGCCLLVNTAFRLACRPLRPLLTTYPTLFTPFISSHTHIRICISTTHRF